MLVRAHNLLLWSVCSIEFELHSTTLSQKKDVKINSNSEGIPFPVWNVPLINQ